MDIDDLFGGIMQSAKTFADKSAERRRQKRMQKTGRECWVCNKSRYAARYQKIHQDSTRPL